MFSVCYSISTIVALYKADVNGDGCPASPWARLYSQLQRLLQDPMTTRRLPDPIEPETRWTRVLGGKNDHTLRVRMLYVLGGKDDHTLTGSYLPWECGTATDPSFWIDLLTLYLCHILDNVLEGPGSKEWLKKKEKKDPTSRARSGRGGSTVRKLTKYCPA
ncbi:hypothetical protein C8R42DRAFT_713656 [Lentinula raphanica]|nr:hypothetical protein C8R42DRAFT_713656 [Lentinula raphanica]